ncbi:MAG: hypothetical protein WAM42_16285, partial [Candidatus Nitrosopolaris sp.]
MSRNTFTLSTRMYERLFQSAHLRYVSVTDPNGIVSGIDWVNVQSGDYSKLQIKSYVDNLVDS